MSCSSMFMWNRSASSFDVPRRQRLQQFDAGVQRVDQVRLVAIERLVDQRHAVLFRMFAEVVQCLGEIPVGRRRIDAVAVAALHRADDGRGAERAGEVDDRADEGAGLACEPQHREGRGAGDA